MGNGLSNKVILCQGQCALVVQREAIFDRRTMEILSLGVIQGIPIALEAGILPTGGRHAYCSDVASARVSVIEEHLRVPAWASLSPSCERIYRDWFGVKVFLGYKEMSQWVYAQDFDHLVAFWRLGLALGLHIAAPEDFEEERRGRLSIALKEARRSRDKGAKHLLLIEAERLGANEKQIEKALAG